MHRFTVVILFLSSMFVATSASAAFDERFKRDAVDSHAEDMARMLKLHNELKSMAELKVKLKGQRRSDQVESETSSTTTSTSAIPPMARMAFDDPALSVKTAATVAPVQFTASSAQFTASSVYSAAGSINSTVSPGNSSAVLRACLHPKDVNCKHDTVSVRKKCGMKRIRPQRKHTMRRRPSSLKRNDSCEGDSCKDVLPKASEDKSKTNKTNVDIFGFLKRAIFWEN